MVEPTHLTNMLVKLDQISPNFRGENEKISETMDPGSHLGGSNHTPEKVVMATAIGGGEPKMLAMPMAILRARTFGTQVSKSLGISLHTQ